MRRPMIEKIKTRLRSALNNAKYMTTGNLAHNKACVEMMVEASLNDIDQIVVEQRDIDIEKACKEFANFLHTRECSSTDTSNEMISREKGVWIADFRRAMEGDKL